MKERLKFVVMYFAFWTGFFVLAKLIFLVAFWHRTVDAGFPTVVGIVVHGLRMDAAAAAHLIIVPLICVLLSSYLPWRFLRPVVLWWTLGLVVFVAGLTVGDLGLFAEWGFRIDSTWLMYLNRPKEMLASTASSPIVALLLVFAVFAAAGIWAFRRWFLPAADAWPGGGWPVIPVTLFLIAFMVIPARGGIQLAPLTHSSVSFSTNDFANQAALNTGWNFFNSIYRREYQRDNPYLYLPEPEAKALVASLHAGKRGTPPRLFRVAHPNIILVIWESFTAKVASVTGGRDSVVPAFDSLAKHGILFDNFYATGNRTDKGLPGILSGYPSIMAGAVTKEPRKLAGLPGLPHELAAAGYDTRFLYGGELAWANFRGYLLHVGFANVSGDEVFDGDLSRTTWGFQDHVMFARAAQVADSLTHPFLLTILTLSSHEPYAIPVEHVFPGDDIQDLFLSSHHYTDRSLGDFIAALHRSPLWDSTVVIILGDHGHLLPTLDRASERYDPSSFHIPLLWLGGALAVRDTVIHTLASQTDLARTLLGQLGLPGDQFPWAQDFLAPGYRPFAYYAFADGFGYLTPRGGVTFDNGGRRILQQLGRADSTELRMGMALQQEVNGDFKAR